MRCNQCNCHFEGKKCPNCGTSAAKILKANTSEQPQNHPAEVQERRFVLFGFRSRQWWKMMLSTVYILFCALSLLGVIEQDRSGTMPSKDRTLDIFVDICVMLILVSPYLLFSEWPLRHILPLVKRQKFGTSICAFLLVFITMSFVIQGIDSLHTDAYVADQENHAYVVVEEAPATCKTAGLRLLHCTFCGHDTEEDIPALTHEFVETEQEDGSIRRICSHCGTAE